MSIYLEKRRPAENMARFYRIQVTPTLFGQWAVIREWGRIGSKGQSLEVWVEQADDATQLMEQLAKRKQRKGYIKN